YAEGALPYAEALARSGGARLLLVRAALAHTVPGADPTADQVRAVAEAETYLADVVGRLKGAKIVETAVFYGRPVEAILEEVELRRVDLIVMATHGRSGLGRWLYGSVAEAVVSRSPAPVLLVRAGPGKPTNVAVAAGPRAIVPLDGSAFAEE